jgi:putative ABC transport system substrate-binding protein
MRRRDFITLLGGVVASTCAARAQQIERVRRIGVLMANTEGDRQAQERLKVFQEAIRALGWTDGGNLHINYRWAGNDVNRFRTFAAELVALNPDAILGDATPSVAALVRVTRSIPIVFTRVADPVVSGFVRNLARPGGNVTGFTNYEASMAGKWLALLKELAPQIMRAALVYNPQTAPYTQAFLGPFEAAARAAAVEPVKVAARDAAELEVLIAMQGRKPGGGLIVMPDISNLNHRELIITLAARYRLPAIYNNRSFTGGGGLISYGIDPAEMYRGAASYVDRILKGAKPADLPVQAPTKFELIVNLSTAKTLGITVPPTLLTRADTVIE